MTKAEEILRKEITLFEWGKENDKQLITYEDALKAVNKAINYTHSCTKLSDCVIHSTDWNGKCFNCGEQVFVREEKQ